MITLDFTVSGQQITRNDTAVVVANSRNWVKAHFAFTPELEGFKYAIFKNGAVKGKEPIIDGECWVPPTVMQTAGYMDVSVIVGDCEPVTNFVLVRLFESGDVSAEVLPDPEPGIAYIQTLAGALGVQMLRFTADGNIEGYDGTTWHVLLLDKTTIETIRDAIAQYATNAAASEVAAKASETAAKTSETNAAGSAVLTAQLLSNASEAEQARIDAENGRKSAEDGRVSAETERVQADELRGTTVAAIEAAYAPRLTNVESGLQNASSELAAKAKQIDLDTTNQQVSTNTVRINTHTSQIAALSNPAPKVASLVSQMTDTTKNYVYTGSENGYTAGNWYYYNGTAWVSGGVYLAASIGDGGVKYNNIEATLRSLFSEIWTEQSLTYTSGYFLSRGTGALTSIATIRYGVIPVIAGERYKISSSYYIGTAFYVIKDSAGNTLLAPPSSAPESLTTLTDVEITIPTNGAFLYVNDIRIWQISAIKPIIKKFTGYSNNAIPVSSFDSNLKNALLTDNAEPLTINYTNGSYIGVDGNAVAFASINYGAVAVSEGDVIRITTSQYAATAAYIIKNDLGVIIAKYPASSQTVSIIDYIDYEITIPTAGATLYINDIRGWQSVAKQPIVKRITKVLKNPVNSTDFVAVQNRVTSLENSKVGSITDILYGKKLGTAGDSITEGTAISVDTTYGIRMTYGAITAIRHNMTFYNYGISGSTMQNIGGKNPFCVSRYQSMASDLDYLTIWFGWNDNAYGVLGTISDTVDTTYYGAYNIVLKWLLINRPALKIGLIVPYGASAGIRQAVRDLGKKWGVPYLDLYDNTKVPLFFGMDSVANSDVTSVISTKQSAFLVDGCHPNTVGYQYLATIYENFLKSL